METLPPFEPSRFLEPYEIERGLGKARIISFDKGYAIQLGGCGAYYPETRNNKLEPQHVTPPNHSL